MSPDETLKMEKKLSAFLDIVFQTETQLFFSLNLSKLLKYLWK